LRRFSRNPGRFTGTKENTAFIGFGVFLNSVTISPPILMRSRLIIIFEVFEVNKYSQAQTILNT
jgi:hypothetical protein